MEGVSNGVPFLCWPYFYDKKAKNQCFYYDQRYVPGHKCSGRLFSLEIVEDSRDCEDETKVQCNERVFGYEDKEVKMERGEPNDCSNESDMAAQPEISLMQSQR
nr:UDP-glycosyltransferase 83A1-like [Tanacetum cinerariifolium]